MVGRWGDHDTGRAADGDDLPPLFKPLGAAPPLVTDIDLSIDDHWLCVSCWGTGELKRYDVSDADVPAGGLIPDSRFFPHGNDFRGPWVHQTRLQGGDAASDSYCFTG